MPRRSPRATDLSRYVYLSILAAVVTITLEVIAWRLTGSVGLFSHAAESVVNLVAAMVIMWTAVERLLEPPELRTLGSTRPDASLVE